MIFINIFKPKLRHTFIMLFVATLISACSVYEIQDADPLPVSARWVLLPVINHSDTPDAGHRVSEIAATLVRSRGVNDLSNYAPQADDNSMPALDQRNELITSIEWAKQQGFRYGLSGSVQEWRYKSGLDGEPVAGITINVIDLNDGHVIWAASGSKTGWGRESVSGVAHKLISVLLDGLELTE